MPTSQWFSQFLHFQDTIEILETPDIPDKNAQVKMTMKRTLELPISAVIEAYTRQGSNVDKPLDQINALNIILGKGSFVNGVTLF